MTIVRTASDAWVREAVPGQNYGQATQLWLNGGAAGNDRQAFIHLKPPFPIGATVISAKLRVWTKGAWSGTQQVTAKRVTQKWAEGRVDWNTKPTVTATHSAAVSVVGAADKQLIEFDVLTMMADVASGSGYFGVRLELDTDVDRAVRSAEDPDATLRPQLEVVWAAPPDAPSGLTPGGANVIDVAKPILSWVYTDPNGGESQSSSQVQISTSSSFASPEYDSGKVANTVSQWDLSATAYAGVPAAATRFWRVRVWDETDLVSAWSDPVSFTRTAKGTLTLTTPATGGIADLTPLISWSLASATQEAYRVIIQNLTMTPALDPGGTVVQDTGRITSAATSIRPIPGRINDHDTYRITVRVWDTVDRQSIPGDPAYYEVTRDVSYSRAGVGTAVTGLTATLPVANGPGVQLDFSRTTAPDYFALKIDGVVVLPRILPSDVFVSGTSYRLTYYGVTPRVSHTFEVEAVTLSGGVYQHSSGNSTASQTTNTDGVWLVDPVDGLAVRMAGTSDPDIGIGEAATTFELPGSRTPVRITDGVRGYEGSWSGWLKGKTDRNTFLTLKGRLRTLRLVMSDLNVPVFLEEVAAPPTALSADRLYGVSFAFRQVDEYTFTVAGG